MNKKDIRKILSRGDPGYRQCVRCIMDTTDPWIEFQENGECSHCAEYDRFRTFWNPEGNRPELEQLMDTIRRDGKGYDYDAIMGLSGGVDSSYVAHIAKEFDLRVLVIHVDTGWNSELAVKNIENIITKYGFDLVTDVVDWEAMRDLQLAFFRAAVPNQDIPQDHAINAGFFNFAAKNKVKWSLSGSNFSCESILPQSWGYDSQDIKHIRAISDQFGSPKTFKKFPKMGYFKHDVVHRVFSGLQVARPLNLIPYRKEEAMKTLTEDVGWQYYGGKHYESRFTKFFQGWYLPHRFGFDKRMAHLSSVVLSGQMTRDAALQEFDKGHLTDEDVRLEHDYMARKLGLSDIDFEELMQRPLCQHTDYPMTDPVKREKYYRWGSELKVRLEKFGINL
jgi:N-acetyl sugar amidotransferase